MSCNKSYNNLKYENHRQRLKSRSVSPIIPTKKDHMTIENDPFVLDAPLLENNEQKQTSTRQAKRVRKKKTLTKTKRNIVGKRKKHKPKSAKRYSPLKNIFWGTQQQAWMGNIRVKGTIVRSCSRKSDVQAAKILNSRCREKGITPPNPAVGFVDSTSESKYLSKTKKEPKEPENRKPTSGQLWSAGQFMDIENVKPNRPDGFNNVAWSPMDQAYVGTVRVNSEMNLTALSSVSAEMCAKMLNSKCHEIGFPLPNPDVGLFIKREPFESFSKISSNTDYFMDQDFDSFPYKSNPVMDHLRLPPPLNGCEQLDDEPMFTKSPNLNEPFKSPNLMFQILSDLLPASSYHENSGASLLVDDLPFLKSPRLFY